MKTLNEKMFASKIFILGIIILVTSCGSFEKRKLEKQSQMKGTISISGAFALYPMTVKWAEEFQKKYPDVRVDISAGGAGKGMADALSGMVDLGMFSREVTPVEIQKGAWYIAVTKDAVVATINSKNPASETILSKGLTKTDLQELFLKDKKHFWKEYLDVSITDPINVYTRSDACGAAEMWGKFLGANQERLMGIGVFGDPGIADAIKNDPLGIGFNNINYAYNLDSRKVYEGMIVVPLDLNEDGILSEDEKFYHNLDSLNWAIKQGKYPSPPARDLYFVSRGKPQNKIVIEFIRWILTEGQQFVEHAGYVSFPEDKIEFELKKIED